MSKVSKESVNYKTATSVKKRCATCVMSHFGTGKVVGTCDLVEGPISVNGVCDKWEAK